MLRWLTWCVVAASLLGIATPCSLWACSLCDSSSRMQSTLREELLEAKAVLYGSLANPRFAIKTGTPGRSGTTDLNVLQVLRDDPARGGSKTLQIANYLDVPDPASPPRFIAFCAVKNGQLDVYHGRVVKTDAVLPYLAGVMELQNKNRTQQLQFYFKYLDNADPLISQDAFLEFARCTDVEVANIAQHLPAVKLEALLKDPKTPPERLGLYAFLLGASGQDKDAAALLRAMIEHPTDRMAAALDGLLSGYIHLRPREGWELTAKILGDAKKPFNQRISVIRTLRFYHAWKPAECKQELLRCLAITVSEGEIADFAIEDLRQWKMWDLTKLVLSQYGKPTHDSPLARRGIIRYALCCPEAEARQFITGLRQRDPELVRELEESLEFEKGK